MAVARPLGRELDVIVLHELRPLSDIAGKELSQFVGAAAAHHRPRGLDAGAEFGLPHLACILSATARAVVSIEPPGAVGTMTFTGWSGKVCANASEVEAASVNPNASACGVKCFMSFHLIEHCLQVGKPLLGQGCACVGFREPGRIIRRCSSLRCIWTGVRQLEATSRPGLAKPQICDDRHSGAGDRLLHCLH